MKRYSLGLVFVLVLVLGTAAFAVFPTPDTTATFTVQQGFGPNGQLVWYFCTDTNDIGLASTNQFPFRQMTLAPPLASLYNPSLAPGTGINTVQVYYNTGYQQGPIFPVVPGTPHYTGKWSVVFIIWLPGQARRVCNLQPYDPVTNPYGFPITTPGPTQQATLSASYGTVRAGAVVDCPIVAVGRFPTGGPWFPGGAANANPAVFYRLPQVLAFNAYYKTVTLPAWYVYCQDSVSRYINRCTVIIPDVSDPVLAARLKANWAPALVFMDEENAQDMSVIVGRVFGDVPPPPFEAGGPVGPLRAVNQYPIIEECPTGIGPRNTNREYTPFMEFDLLYLTDPLDPANLQLCFVNNADFAELLEENGFFTEVENGFVNAPVIDCSRILPPTGACCLPCPEQ